MTRKQSDQIKTKRIYEFGWHPEQNRPSQSLKKLKLPNFPRISDASSPPTSPTPSEPPSPLTSATPPTPPTLAAPSGPPTSPTPPTSAAPPSPPVLPTIPPTVSPVPPVESVMEGGTEGAGDRSTEPVTEPVNAPVNAPVTEHVADRKNNRPNEQAARKVTPKASHEGNYKGNHKGNPKARQGPSNHATPLAGPVPIKAFVPKPMPTPPEPPHVESFTPPAEAVPVEVLMPSAEPVEVGQESAPPTNAIVPVKRRRRRVGWPVLGLGILGLSGGVAVGALLWLTQLPPLPDCDNLSRLAADAERLYCVQQAAQSGDLEQLTIALNLAGQWTAEHPLHTEGQRLMASWSAMVLAIAQTQLEQSDLESALAIARRIPSSSPTYPEVQATLAQWQEQWQQGESAYLTAQEALQAQNWDLASAQVTVLGVINNDHWRRRSDQLAAQVLMERRARQLLQRAVNLAKSNQPEQLGKAIALTHTEVDRQTYAWKDAQVQMDQWSQILLDTGTQAWEAGQFDRAITLAAMIPNDLSLAQEAQSLIDFSKAEKLANQGTPTWAPSMGQIVGLMEAIAAVKPIQPSSRFYAKAEAKLADWQGQIQDLVQLQLANTTASLGHYATYQLAIQQAELVAPDRPRRIQAQTLVAHWTRELQRIEDRPVLEQARQLAAPETIPALREAIATARQIELGRALRNEAQGEIAKWTRRIETLEDQPILDAAWTLAQRGRLSEAIQEAGRIASGRALHGTAQAAIGQWQAEIQIARDRSILNEAYGLAAEVRLTAAIDVASQIGPGRPLYGEARSAIAQWSAERAEIWSAWDAEEPDEVSSDDFVEDSE